MSTVTQAIFGSGALGTVANGLIRIPALMANFTAGMMIGECAFRALSNIWQVFFTVRDGSWLDEAGKGLHKYGIRPFKDEQEYSNTTLAVTTVAMVAFSIASTELALAVAGPAPLSIYNWVLAWIGPMRLTNDSWLTLAANTFGG